MPWTAIDLVVSVGAGTVLGIVLGGITTVAMFALGRPSRAVTFFVIGIEVYAGIAVMIWLLIVKRRGLSLRELGFRPVSTPTIALMVPLAVGVWVLNLIVSGITALLFGDVPTASDQLAVGTGMSVMEFVLLLVVAAVVAPVVEEVVFRGLLYRVVRVRWGVALAGAGSAFAFALVHFIPLLIGVFFVFGLILAAITERYQSLYPAITLHALNNAGAISVVFAMQ